MNKTEFLSIATELEDGKYKAKIEVGAEVAAGLGLMPNQNAFEDFTKKVSELAQICQIAFLLDKKNDEEGEL